jgi:hypothetical protein
VIRDADPSADILCRDDDQWRGGRRNESGGHDGPYRSEMRKSEIATASPVRVQCQRWVMLLTINVGSHLKFFFFGGVGWVTISRRSSFYLPLAGPRDLHMFVRQNMEWVYPFLENPLGLHSFNEIDR